MIVSYKIAKLLASKGFTQPEAAFAQTWYLDYDNGQNTLGKQVLVGTNEFHICEGFPKVFAPTVTDILPFVGCFIKYDFVMLKFGIGFDGVINFFDNPADGLALFWLNAVS